jgi:hypothetical protein
VYIPAKTWCANGSLGTSDGLTKSHALKQETTRTNNRRVTDHKTDAMNDGNTRRKLCIPVDIGRVQMSNQTGHELRSERNAEITHHPHQSDGNHQLKSNLRDGINDDTCSRSNVADCELTTCVAPIVAQQLVVICAYGSQKRADWARYHAAAFRACDHLR